MLNITTNQTNIAKYKDILPLSDLSEQFSKDRHELEQNLNISPYIILLGDNDFNGIGYFYFKKQQCSKNIVSTSHLVEKQLGTITNYIG